MIVYLDSLDEVLHQIRRLDTGKIVIIIQRCHCKHIWMSGSTIKGHLFKDTITKTLMIIISIIIAIGIIIMIFTAQFSPPIDEASPTKMIWHLYVRSRLY